MLFCVFFVYEIIFTSLEHFEYYFSFSTSVFFLFHKCPLLLLVPYKSDSRAVNRDWAPLGFGTPLGGKWGFFSTSSAPAWLVLPKMDQCHCLYLYLGKYFTFFFSHCSSKEGPKIFTSWDGEFMRWGQIWRDEYMIVELVEKRKKSRN